MAPSTPNSTSESRELFWFYVGINVENILYGFELYLYFETMRIFSKNNGAHKLFYALFSSMMLFLITIWVATQAVFGQNMWLINSNFPGGPSAYWDAYISIWYMNFATTAIVVLQLMMDALMIHRCRMIWNSYRVVAVPIILWLVAFVFGLLVDWMTSAPGADFFTGVPARLSLAYWSIAVFLNTTLTCMICYPILRHGRRMQTHSGDEYASLYFAIAAIIVESVLPYTLTGIAFLVSLGVGSPISVGLLSLYLPMMCISPQMLILRVMKGKAWDHDTFSRAGSTIRFSPGSQDWSRS